MDVLETDEGDECISDSMPYSLAFELKLFQVNEHIRSKTHMIFQKEADLQTMCLNVIADNIMKYTWIYLRCEHQKQNPQRVHFEGLRRVYSDRLYKMVKRRQDSFVSSVVLSFFITPYWKKVRLREFDSLFTRLRVVGKAITSLNLQDSLASSDLLTAALCCVPNIVYLNLVSTECDSSVLALISKACKSLENLNIGECRKVTDIGIAYLYNLDRKEIGFNSLKSLNVNGTKVTEKSIPLILKYLTSLEYLRYVAIEIVLYDLYLHDMISGNDRFNLVSFEPTMASISLPRYENIELIDMLQLWTRLCPKVTRIHIKEDIDERILRLLAKFEHLTALRLNNIRGSLLLTDTAFFRLRAAQLTEIHFRSVFLSIDCVIKSCPNLKKLTLDGVALKDFKIPEEGKLNDLDFFRLKHINLMADNVFKCVKALLSSASNLSKLAITYCSYFNEDIATCILACPNITSLNFSYTDVKPDVLDMILASENIKSICADGCPHITRQFPYMTHVNNNPKGNTCGWKIGSGYFDDVEDDKWSDSPWIQGLSF